MILSATIFYYTKQNQSQSDHYAIQSANISLGIQMSPAMALPMIAKEKGYFQNNGLNVEIKEFAAGKDALTAFLGGSLDFSISGEVPANLAILNGNKNFIVPAQVVNKTVNEVRLVATNVPSGSTAQDFFKSSKKKLGTSIGGGPEFYTYEFLKKNNINKDEVEIISQKPADLPIALSSGSLDAIAIFDPFAYIAESLLKDKSTTFKDDSLYSELYIVEAKTTTEGQKNIVQFLKSLKEAEVFVKINPSESKQIVAKYTKLDPKVIEGVWSSFDFGVALKPELTQVWEKQTSWAKETNKVKPETVNPNYAEIIKPEFLGQLTSK